MQHKLIDFSRTGDSFGIYLIMPDGALIRFAHVPLSNLRSVKKAADRLGFRTATRRSAHEIDLVRSDLGHAIDGYRAQRADVPADQCPHYWSSTNALAWHVGWYMAATGRSEPRYYKKRRGYTIDCNDMTLRADWDRRHGSHGILLTRSH